MPVITKRLTNRHRPPASTTRGLQERHIQPIDIRTFFSVDFDVHIVFVHELGSDFVFETFVREDVAPYLNKDFE